MLMLPPLVIVCQFHCTSKHSWTRCDLVQISVHCILYIVCTPVPVDDNVRIYLAHMTDCIYETNQVFVSMYARVNLKLSEYSQSVFNENWHHRNSFYIYDRFSSFSIVSYTSVLRMYIYLFHSLFSLDFTRCRFLMRLSGIILRVELNKFLLHPPYL